MRVTVGRMATLALMAGVLAACGGSGSRGDAGDDRTAEGEVRGGTISDDMLPLDTVRSQSPPLRAGGSEEGPATEEPAEPEGEAATDAAAGAAGAVPAESASATPPAQ